MPENDFGQGFETNDNFSSSYPSTSLTLGLGKSVNVTAHVLSDWTGNESTHLSLKSGEIIEVTENQVCIYLNTTKINYVAYVIVYLLIALL